LQGKLTFFEIPYRVDQIVQPAECFGEPFSEGPGHFSLYSMSKYKISTITTSVYYDLPEVVIYGQS
jgi:hypothetical protein